MWRVLLEVLMERTLRRRVVVRLEPCLHSYFLVFSHQKYNVLRPENLSWKIRIEMSKVIGKNSGYSVVSLTSEAPCNGEHERKCLQVVIASGATWWSEWQAQNDSLCSTCSRCPKNSVNISSVNQLFTKNKKVYYPIVNYSRTLNRSIFLSMLTRPGRIDAGYEKVKFWVYVSRPTRCIAFAIKELGMSCGYLKSSQNKAKCHVNKFLYKSEEKSTHAGSFDSASGDFWILSFSK